MARQQQYKIRVVGDGAARASGMLAFVVPQALDLVADSSYVVSVCPVGRQPEGFLRFRRKQHGIEATYERNVNLPLTPAATKTPAWCEQAISMSHELGRNVTWRQPQNQT